MALKTNDTDEVRDTMMDLTTDSKSFVTVTLNGTEIAKAIALGRKRNAAKDVRWRESGARFHRDVKDRAYPHVIGVLGEFAFAKLTGLPLNEELYSHGDSGIDFGEFEIKATTIQPISHPKLIVKPHDLERGRIPKYYVLASIRKSYRVVTFIGFITGDDFLKNRKWDSEYKVWFVEGNRLTSLRHLGYNERVG